MKKTENKKHKKKVENSKEKKAALTQNPTK